MESSYRALVTSFTDFLTVAIHTILYERDLYPRTSFLSARKYNFSVRQNRHPKVCEWINDAVASVETELLKGTVDYVAVVICTRENSVVERFMFDVSRFPTVPFKSIDLPLRRTNDAGEKVAILPTVDMEEQFKANMARLANCSSHLNPLPEGCTFAIAIELKKEADAPISHSQDWMPLSAQIPGSKISAAQQKQALPLGTVSAEEMVFETWVEADLM
ncbi:DNA-binding protein [Piedraia hortae CBS 480.64]|uniref:DNA-binding protein n=1 Tax=Piedraia hortae CBS 480.64 TaxID=1314780 RepID=A0A6A7BQE1_9PEZI|nr:DNA-binding protein [Piedraia hortae CBS 480.64]